MAAAAAIRPPGFRAGEGALDAARSRARTSVASRSWKRCRRKASISSRSTALSQLRSRCRNACATCGGAYG
eukprot:366577-Chlamydomonas_euryale.AAC.8